MCRYFVQGKCNKGDKCTYSHDERYKSKAHSVFVSRKKGGKGKGKKGKPRKKGKGRGAGAVDETAADGQADHEDNEEELDYIEVELEPAGSADKPPVQ